MLEVEPRCTGLTLDLFCLFHLSISCSLGLLSCTVCFHASLLRDIAGRTWTYLLPSSTSKRLSISLLKLHTYTNVCVSMLLWHLMTIIPHYHFLILNCRKSLLEIVPSAWTPLWLIHHCVGDPNHPINEEIGTTKDLALWKEIALELMWRLRGIITVLHHALNYLWVGLFRNLLNLLNLFLYDSTLNAWKRSVLDFVLSIPLITRRSSK